MASNALLSSLAAIPILNSSLAFAADCFSNSVSPLITFSDFRTALTNMLHPTFPDEFDSLLLDNHAPLILATASSARMCVRNENFDALSLVEFTKVDMLGGIADIYSQCLTGADESASGTFQN